MHAVTELPRPFSTPGVPEMQSPRFLDASTVYRDQLHPNVFEAPFVSLGIRGSLQQITKSINMPRQLSTATTSLALPGVAFVTGGASGVGR